jgi:CHRD domain
MSEFHTRLTIVGLTAIMIGAVSSIIPLTIYAQQQGTNFVATLSGKNMVPPVNTAATGAAKFHLNPNGTLSYEVDVSNINGVIGAPVGAKNGTELVELLNLYATTGGGNKQQSAYPTGPVNGQLVSGVITADKLDGPLFGKNVTDLVNMFKTKSIYVTVRTTQNQHGEIQGQIVPSS